MTLCTQAKGQYTPDAGESLALVYVVYKVLYSVGWSHTYAVDHFTPFPLHVFHYCANIPTAVPFMLSTKKTFASGINGMALGISAQKWNLCSEKRVKCPAYVYVPTYNVQSFVQSIH